MEGTPAWKESLEKAKTHFKIADHMAYVTLTLLKDNRLLIKILTETAEAVGFTIKAMLQKAYDEKKIRIYQNPDTNFQVFLEHIAPHYLTKEDTENIIKIMEIRKKHINAPVEFVRKEKFIILLGDKYETLTIDIIKSLMNSTRRLLSKASIGV